MQPWFDNRSLFAKFLRYLVDECHCGVYDLVEVVKNPRDWQEQYEEWQAELYEQGESDRQADSRRKMEQGGS